MILLMNSSMMPSDGTYKRQTVSKKEWKKIFEVGKKAVTKKEWKRIFEVGKKAGWKSYIGYPNACKYASEVLGEEIVLSRDEVDFRVGDVALVLKLRYRVAPESKKTNIQYDENDYEFIVVEKIA